MTTHPALKPGPAPTLGIVLPFFRKLAEFERVATRNAPYWSRPWIEVVLVLDENAEEAGVLRLVDRLPGIRWRVVVNDVAHAWRPPCKAINVGVRHTRAPWVFIHSPESAYVGDAPARALQIATASPRAVAVGRVGFARFDEAGTDGDALAVAFAQKVPDALLLSTFYGSLCCAREAFESVCGYDERFDQWGGDDDDFRVRLEMAGGQLMADPALRLMHLSFEERTGAEAYDRDLDWRRCTPQAAQVNTAAGADWGRGFDRVARDTGSAAFGAPPETGHGPAVAFPMGSRRQCEVCGRMVHHEPSPVYCPRCSAAMPAAARLTSRPRIVGVLQVRNEARFLAGCLAHLRDHVDGIVVLDDGSTDGTPDILRRESKVLEVLTNPVCEPHVWRENENKRRLLECARRHGAGWVLVCDADERYESLFLDHLPAIVDSMSDDVLSCLSVACCELWNSPCGYRVDGIWGRKSRARLFRLPQEIGFDETLALHGAWYPDQVARHGLMFGSYYRLYHLGSIRHEDRLRRRATYNQLDPTRGFQSIGYDYLAEEGPSLRIEGIGTDRGYALSTLPADLMALAKSP